ncbi:MAG: ribosome silencing factor [Armatimonadetes bacterium]|nr:ribosome silencing factor [Armatimonadota bacterium]
MRSSGKAMLIAQAADAKQARDMSLLDLRGLTLVTDYFLIATGGSGTHIRAIVDHIRETMKKNGAGGIRLEGYDDGHWVLMDYGDVVVHIMDAPTREYFRLEERWSDAKTVALNFPATVSAHTGVDRESR